MAETKAKNSTITSIFKWLVIGFLGTVGLICATVVLLIWKFSPLVSVDEKSQRVSVLGGLIDVNDIDGKISINGNKFTISDEKSKKVSGTQTLDGKKIDTLRIPFGNGQVSISTSKDNSVHWSCRFNDSNRSGQLMEQASVATFDFSEDSNVKCEIQVPKKLKAVLEGHNGKVSIEEPTADTSVTLHNGYVSLKPAKDVAYNYDLNVKRGMVEDFESSNSPKAVKVKVKLHNGAISKD